VTVFRRCTSAAPAAPDPAPAVGSAQTVTPDGDSPQGETGHNHEYVAAPTKWDDTDLTYAFVNHTRDLSVAAQESAVAAALNTWASVSSLTFTKVADCGLAFDHPNCTTPDIRIMFGSGRHTNEGFDPAFDGPGGTAAHAFYPPPGGDTAPGDIHFDDAERWITSGSGVDLQSITLHEAGHALGIKHASDLQCLPVATASRPIMCSTIIGTDRTLAQDDINGIQHLYGLPGLQCAGRAVTVDLNEGERPTAGADVILGTPGDDKISSGGGADIVCGGTGNDVIDTGAGNDRLTGRTGTDRLDGGGGSDKTFGGDSNDQLFGGTGADTLDGGAGADKLYAGAQVDACNGRAGRDASSGCERSASIESRLR
jgi:Ca2+-binding RTX toxin-like protein